MRVRKFNLHQSRWNTIRKSQLGNNWITIERPVTLWGLKAGHGQMVTAIDVRINELPKDLQLLANKLN